MDFAVQDAAIHSHRGVVSTVVSLGCRGLHSGKPRWPEAKQLNELLPSLLHLRLEMSPGQTRVTTALHEDASLRLARLGGLLLDRVRC